MPNKARILSAQTYSFFLSFFTPHELKKAVQSMLLSLSLCSSINF